MMNVKMNIEYGGVGGGERDSGSRRINDKNLQILDSIIKIAVVVICCFVFGFIFSMIATHMLLWYRSKSKNSEKIPNRKNCLFSACKKRVKNF